jgi:hypothetical protein
VLRLCQFVEGEGRLPQSLVRTSNRLFCLTLAKKT